MQLRQPDLLGVNISPLSGAAGMGQASSHPTATHAL